MQKVQLKQPKYFTFKQIIGNLNNYNVTDQIHVLGMGKDSFAKVNGPVDNRLFLLSLQYPWDYALSCDSVAPVVYHNCAQSVQARQIHGTVDSHTLQIISL